MCLGSPRVSPRRDILRGVVVLPVRFERSPRLHAMLSAEPHAVGTRVVVQGKRGPEVATVRGEASTPSDNGRYGTVLRAAGPEDLARWDDLFRQGEDLKWLLRARARERRLPVKIVAVEFTLDESLVTISYSAEDRIELGSLIADLRNHTRARVNFAAVGPREQAQMIGTLGPAGARTARRTTFRSSRPSASAWRATSSFPSTPKSSPVPAGACCAACNTSTPSTSNSWAISRARTPASAMRGVGRAVRSPSSTP